MAVLQGERSPSETRAVELLREAELRVTRPRVAVLSRVVEAGEEHLSADELLERLERDEGSAHRATVYRTLEGLTTAGVLCHVHLDRGLTAYHLSPEYAGRALGHLHAQCARCGRVVDLPRDVLGDTADRIRLATGFRLDPAHVAFSGTCRKCHRQGDRLPPTTSH